MSRQLDVFINDDRVGRLREENDLWAFDYDPGWVASPQSFDLSPALARTVLTHVDGASERPVQWYFDNLLPEEALRTVFAKEANLKEEDAFGLLAYYGAESAGSLVLQDPETPRQAESGLSPLPDEILNQRIRDLPRLPLNHRSPKHMSLAGAQHKLPIVYCDGQLYEPLPGDISTHILKPNHQSGDYRDSVMNEYFVMTLAARAGLNVPQVYRRYCPEPVYIIDRFDRPRAGGHICRQHVIDTCQLLNKSRGFKYKSANVETLRDVLQYVRVRQAGRLALYRWLVFNLLVGNGDNHLKNVSFLVSHEGVEVAPFYDLLCTAAYSTRAMANERAAWPRVELALSLPGATYFSDVTRASVLESGRLLGLTPAAAERELDRLLQRVAPLAETLEGEIAEENKRQPHPSSASELRLLRAIRHIVIVEMTARLR